jgi:hypothetical protein
MSVSSEHQTLLTLGAHQLRASIFAVFITKCEESLSPGQRSLKSDLREYKKENVGFFLIFTRSPVMWA